MFVRSFVTLVLVFACLVHTTSFSQTAPLKMPDTGELKKIQAGLKVETKRFSGRVVSINPVSQTLVVKSWRGEATFDAASAKIARHVNLEDLRPGDRILVNYIEEAGRKTAKVLVATSAGSEEKNKSESSKTTKPLMEAHDKK
jgi:hypothetical protein